MFKQATSYLSHPTQRVPMGPTGLWILNKWCKDSKWLELIHLSGSGGGGTILLRWLTSTCAWTPQVALVTVLPQTQFLSFAFNLRGFQIPYLPSSFLFKWEPFSLLAIKTTTKITTTKPPLPQNKKQPHHEKKQNRWPIKYSVGTEIGWIILHKVQFL